MTKYKDIKEVNFNNITDTGTEGLKLPVGTTAQRGTTEGQIRYNSENDTVEFRDATSHKVLAINSPPSFVTGTGSLGTLNDDGRASSNLTAISFIDDNNAGTVSLKSGSSLPSGITLNSNGTFSGTANIVTSNTTTSFTVELNDGLNPPVERDFSITVNAPVITFATASGSIGSFNDADRGSYSLSPVTATATSGTLSYAVQSGTLPSGLSLNTTTGAITGTLNAVSSDTTSTFTIRATTTSASAFLDRQFTVTVNAPVITFNTASGSIGSFNDADRGSYSLSAVTVTVTSGTLSYAIQSGSLPTSLSLNATTGAITGTLDAVNSNTTFTFTIRATTTSASAFLDREFTITVNAPIITYSTSSGSIATIYDSQRSGFSVPSIQASATSGSVTFSIQSGSVPSGLTLNSNGTITGTANAVGSDTTSNFTVRASHATASVTEDRAFSILVKAPVTMSFGSSSSAQTFDSSSVKSFTAYLWGAGGVGSTGGFVSASVSVASGTNTLYIAVGGAGSAGNDTNVWKGGKGNGGGNGTYSGGGFTGLFTGSSPSQGNAVLIAGGGGSRGSNNNNGPYNGGNHQQSANNCCGTNGGSSGGALQGGTGGGGSQPGGGGGGGYVGGGGGGGACCSGAGGYGGSNYTGGDSGSATTSSTSSVSNNNTGHSLHQSTWGNDSYDGRLLIVF